MVEACSEVRWPGEAEETRDPTDRLLEHWHLGRGTQWWFRRQVLGEFQCWHSELALVCIIVYLLIISYCFFIFVSLSFFSLKFSLQINRRADWYILKGLDSWQQRLVGSEDWWWYDDESPYSPVISGGLVATTRIWWQESGGFDPGMHGWGHLASWQVACFGTATGCNFGSWIDCVVLCECVLMLYFCVLLTVWFVVFSICCLHFCATARQKEIPMAVIQPEFWLTSE